MVTIVESFNAFSNKRRICTCRDSIFLREFDAEKCQYGRNWNSAHYFYRAVRSGESEMQWVTHSQLYTACSCNLSRIQQFEAVIETQDGPRPCAFCARIVARG